MNTGSPSHYKQSDEINSMETARLNNKQHLQYLQTNQPEDLDVHPIPMMSNPTDTLNCHEQDSLREFVPMLQGSGGSTIPSLISPSRQLLKSQKKIKVETNCNF